VVATLLVALACRRVDDPNDARRTPTETPTSPPPGQPDAQRPVVVPDFEVLADRVAPSVVTVVASVEAGSGRNRRGVGSGVIVTAGGQVLTNSHVVAGSRSIEVELAGGERLAAKVVFADDLLDLALLDVEGAGERVPVVFSQSTTRPGAWVMAVGQPFGLGHTVTVGVVGGVGRDHDDLGRPEGLRADGIWSFIQTDASINIGNSGGPLVDASGEVVGITTAVRNDGQGLAFAVPAELARRFLDEVWAHGRVRHTRLGLLARNSEAGLVAGRGSVVEVTAVDDAGPAARAGVRKGDVVLAIDGVPVRRVSDVAYRAQLRGVGAVMTFTVARSDGSTADARVELAEALR
jgi:S1-C subfamily serine protease